MDGVLRVISPVDGREYVERALATSESLGKTLELAARGSEAMASMALSARQRLAGTMIDYIMSQRDDLAAELTRQIGRPIRHSPFEFRGLEERARRMIELSTEALSDVRVPDKPGFERFIRPVPLGVVLVLAPWNFPWLTAINTVVPALLAGNSVLLKHSDQTPLVAERFFQAAEQAGFPPGALQYIHMSHELTARAVLDPRIAHVAFTGSVDGGLAVQRAVTSRFIGVGLELGGKDPAYVRPDADLSQAIDGVIDGAFFNAGQSCCAVERIYVHEGVYEPFVEGAVALVEKYILGDPTDPATTLGPVVRESSARRIRTQIDEAVSAGARKLIDETGFVGRELGACYLPPQILIDVDHRMEVMREETFGPVVGIMKVASDDEAIARMNDSRYGLTASIWTRDHERAADLGERLETGTVFANRCDYLDPDLAWVGVKDSGRGVTLSSLGFGALTRPKSFHLRRSGE